MKTFWNSFHTHR